jgi:hypothetical protein
MSREFPLLAATLDSPGADVTIPTTNNETRRIHE